MMKTKTTQNKTTNNLMDQLLKSSQIATIKKGKEIEATIVSFSKKGIIFDIGGKSQALLGTREVKELSTYLPYLKEGMKLKVRVVSEEARDGYPVVSLQKFFDRGKWDILKAKKDSEEMIDVVCGDYGKGGLFIDFMGIRGVIPKIQLVEKNIDKPENLIRQRIKVKILEVNQEKNRLVVSQKAAVFNISNKELADRFDQIKVGKEYSAKVLGVSDFGIFCEIDGVEGLVHISEISWEKVNSVANYAQPGNMIKVMVAKKNPKDMKLNLSLKRLLKDPWEKIEEIYPKDKEIDGEVIRKEKYGYFVRLDQGIEGLIHISKLTGSEEYKIGQKIKVFVERINKVERRMSLLLPQTARPVTYR